MPSRLSSSTGCAAYRRIARLQRRSFLKVGTLSALGLGMPQYFGLRAAQPTRGARAQSVVLIYAMGGISHHDSFDPKPEAPPEVRGDFKTIPTRLPGIRFSEHLPRLARQADQFALLRSVEHGERCHGVSAYYMLRGYTQPDPSLDRPENQKRANPTIGSHVARLLGSPNGMPPYICVPGLSYLARIDYSAAGWMGRAYDPFVLRSDPCLPGFTVPGLTPLTDVSSARLHERAALARVIDGQCRDLETANAAAGLGAH